MQLTYLSKTLSTMFMINICESLTLICMAVYFVFINLATKGVFGLVAIISGAAVVFSIVWVKFGQTQVRISFRTRDIHRVPCATEVTGLSFESQWAVPHRGPAPQGGEASRRQEDAAMKLLYNNIASAVKRGASSSVAPAPNESSAHRAWR